MDAPINPDHYIVGPGDLFAVSTWTNTSSDFTFETTAEGSLIIPTVGEVRIGDRTLSDARKLIVGAIRKKYISQEPTVTLVRPRSVVVYVYGYVINSGRYVLYASDRVEKAIVRADGEAEENPGRVTPPSTEDLNRRQMIQEYRRMMSYRNIMLRRRDGSVIRVDLAKFHATGDDRWNPSLLEGDEIIVPRNDASNNTIGIYGGVNIPGRYEYVQGESLSDAVMLARGFNAKAVRDSLYLLRLNESKTGFVRKGFGFSSNQQTGTQVRLEPGDRVFVNQEREFRGDYHVTVEGEVQKPGMYPITRDQTRLSDAVTMAGGFTGYALLSAAEVQRLRRSAEEQEASLETQRNLMGMSTVEDTTYFRIVQKTRSARELVAVNLEELFVRGDSSQNVLLQDGDKIVVPSRQRTVYVYGQVVTPGYVPYLKASTISYYVLKAGGYTGGAQSGGAKIIKASSNQWLSPGETDVEEGDAIWVPKTPDRPFTYYLNVIGQTASILTTALTVVILILQLQK